MKREIIEKIKEVIFKEGDCFASFVGDGITFHKDCSKYDLMSVSYDVSTKEVEIESVGYNSFSLSYFKADELNTKTLQMILNRLVRLLLT